MNVYDSDRIAAVLHAHGIQSVDGPGEADIIVVNTCSVRDKAEQKAFSLLGRLAALKQTRPETVLVVAGCVAQQEGRRILDRMPYVDLVIGPHAIPRLPELIRSVTHSGDRIVDTAQAEAYQELSSADAMPASDAVSRFVTIMKGCDNFCSYCVVPYVRGREASRHPERIQAEIESLVAEGVREVTLLGQNVNSYGHKEGMISFAGLLRRIAAIQGLARIRFTTSHPKDLSAELIAVFGDLDVVCPHIHLPIQSGSDSLLKRMNRGYTRAEYLEKIRHLRRVAPDIAITTDIIVGFPGEIENDHDDTIDLLKTVRYDGIFAFRYSDRPPAPAVHFDAKIPESVGKRRLQEILQLQEGITREKNKALIGEVRPVLVEGLSRRIGPRAEFDDATPRWTGRTPCNRIVHIHSDPESPAIGTGAMIPVRIREAHAHSLIGTPATQIDGGHSHAA